jgi:protocatechuate 3,4-dioxygenase beta subunit
MNPCLAASAVLFLALPAAAQVPNPIRVHGSVVLPAGSPADTAVEIVARRGEPCAPLTGPVIAGSALDARGEFELSFELHETGFYLVLESRWLELRPLWIEASADAGPIEVLLAPALRGIVHGRFALSAEAHFPTRPIAGSWVWIEGAGLHATAVDAEDSFELCCPAAGTSAVLCARPREYAPVLLDALALRDGDSTELVLPLVEPAGLSGRILDSGGKGLAGVPLSFWVGLEGHRALALDPWGDLQSVVSGEGGRFEAAGLPPGDLRVHIDDPRWRSLAAQVLGLQPGEQRSGLELVLLRAASLRGVVLDEFAEPVAGARVTAGMREGWGGLMVATTDAQGRYAFDAALPGEYVLSASSEGRCARPGFVALGEGAREQAQLALGRASDLRIHLVDHEAPVLVRVTDRLGFLRADQRVWQGDLELTLPPGVYRVAIETHGGVRREQRIAITGRERGPVLLWI